MASVNKVILIGNLGKDPELKFLPSGVPMVKFSIATTERFKDSEGNQQEKTEWHNIVMWKRQAEIANEYLKKGSPVYIEGRLQTRSWEDENGVKKYMTEVVGLQMQLLGRREDSAAEGPPNDVPEPSGKKETLEDEDDLPF